MTPTPSTPSISATMTVPQAAELMGVSVRSAYRMAEADLLPVFRHGRRIRIITAKLHTMLGLEPAHQPNTEHLSGE